MVEQAAAPGGRGSQPRTREASGHRPPPLWGAARKGWTGQDERGESSAIGLAKSQPSESRKHGPEAQNRRGGAPGGARPAFRTLAPQGVDLRKERCSALRLPHLRGGLGMKAPPRLKSGRRSVG